MARHRTPVDVLQQAAGEGTARQLRERIALEGGDRARQQEGSQTAAPATSPAVPSSEKMPAPTIAPTPMKAACRVLIAR